MKKGVKLAGVLAAVAVLIYFITKWQQNCINLWKLRADKNRGMFLLMDQWVNIKQEGSGLEKYFIKNNYRRIAVYGMGDVGKRLVKELKNSEVEIVCGIDRNRDNIYSDIKIVTMDDQLPCVDVVIVTVLKEFYTIRDALAAKTDCPVVAIEDILNEI